MKTPTHHADEASEAELIEAMSEEHCSGPFLDKLLFAIVSAYPENNLGRTDQQRVNKARKALLGSMAKPKKGSRTTTEALQWMASEYIRDRGGPAFSLGPSPFAWLDANPPGARSVKDLAQEVKRVVQCATESRHLENRFGKDRQSLCISQIFGSDIPDSLHFQAIERIAELVRPFGLKLKLEDD
jgi:hypothetical protein